MMRLVVVAVLLPLVSPAHAGKILIIGDSASVHRDGSAPDGVQSWSFLLEQVNVQHEFVNVAIGGTTTRFWSRNAGIDLFDDHLDAEVILLMLGTNDSGSLHRIPGGEFISRMATIADFFSPDRLYVSLPYDTIGLNADPVGDVLRDGYRESIRTESTSISPLWQLGAELEFMSDPALIIWDGVHPNQDGHVAIAHAVAERVPQLVPEPGTALLLSFGLLGLASRRRTPVRRWRP